MDVSQDFTDSPRILTKRHVIIESIGMQKKEDFFSFPVLTGANLIHCTQADHLPHRFGATGHHRHNCTFRFIQRPQDRLGRVSVLFSFIKCYSTFFPNMLFVSMTTVKVIEKQCKSTC